MRAFAKFERDVAGVVAIGQAETGNLQVIEAGLKPAWIGRNGEAGRAEVAEQPIAEDLRIAGVQSRIVA